MFPIIDKRETGINIRKIMDRQGLTAKDVQQYLELGCVQSVYRWFDGVSMPTVDNLYALSELLRCRWIALYVAADSQLILIMLINTMKHR